MFNITKNAYNIGYIYDRNIDMDLILFVAILKSYIYESVNNNK